MLLISKNKLLAYTLIIIKMTIGIQISIFPKLENLNKNKLAM